MARALTTDEQEALHQHRRGNGLLDTCCWMANTVHQAYHVADPGAWWGSCPKSTCDAARREALIFMGVSESNP